MTEYLLYALLLYLAAINIVAFFLYGIDKWKARHDKWRVTEARKTQHPKFRVGLPLILFLHFAIALAAVYYFYFLQIRITD